MIGVVAHAEDLDAAAEFFELFKTPWELAIPGRQYRVLLSHGDVGQQYLSDAVVAYGTAKHASDHHSGVSGQSIDGPVLVEWAHSVFPLYTGATVFSGSTGNSMLKATGRPLDYQLPSERRRVHRIGYDLFAEVRRLLTEGQPAEYALTPTLELHIALLRHVLLQLGVSFVEVPPRPGTSQFACCLTHDIDFFGIRRHRWDRTMAGFVYRGTIGTIVGLVQQRRTIAEAVRNVLAVMSLPFVFVGLGRDFWQPFHDYAAADAHRGSTFFLAPFKKRPGVAPDGTTDPVRGVGYSIADIKPEIAAAANPRTEFAVHGIDAWRDAEAGRAELAQLTAVTRSERVGVRMHWLYFSGESTRVLEAAGFDYDSTCGFNDAVGYKAGTSQAFRPLGCSTLLELPLSIMDSALFYRGRMELTRDAALGVSRTLVAAARRLGGTLVVNWHDRSLAPERQWNTAYRSLLDEIEADGPVWFATAAEAVDWFRWRRSIAFRSAADSNDVVIDTCAAQTSLPGGRIAVHRPGRLGQEPEERPFVAGESVRVTL